MHADGFEPQEPPECRLSIPSTYTDVVVHRPVESTAQSSPWSMSASGRFLSVAKDRKRPNADIEERSVPAYWHDGYIFVALHSW